MPLRVSYSENRTGADFCLILWYHECDLFSCGLVKPRNTCQGFACNGKEYGRLLLERVCMDFPNDTICVMSDVDPYYEKLGYEREGSVFIVRPKQEA